MATFQFNGPSKLIVLEPGTTTFSVRDLWSRWVDWVGTSDNSKYLPAMTSVGGNDIDVSVGTSIPPYVFLLNGWKVRPQEANHSLSVTGGVLLVDGGGDPFTNTLGTFNVRINYSQPVQAITVNTGGGGGGSAPSVSDIWSYPENAVSDGTLGGALVTTKNQATIAATNTQE